MLLRLQSLQQMPLDCRDATGCGAIEDFLFDEEYGAVRFVSVSVGREPSQRNALLPARALRLHGTRLEVALRRSALEVGAGSRTKHASERLPHHPTGRAARATRLRTPGFALPPAVPRSSLRRSALRARSASETLERAPHDIRLRSFEGLRRAAVLIEDGRVGRFDDFIVSQDRWTLRHLVVALDPGTSGGHDAGHERECVLVGLSWIRRIDWGAPSIHVDLPREQLLRSPRLESGSVVPHEFERQVYDFHGRR